ncbi:hypothetical protein ASPVEDRAFT_86114 [Aspergillus versicolor CBS 583.65]|uniref:Uncharacterized protein n=1 Tax=Aspergillus versicolor CBS 583.65 TaxID=1036611 RepID=A0A1L9PT98_ASPVE|nr:uncharacterized protein ASPVEDRAFT_86114 [Aspergillus versicolor CBS 583.65]OJJ04731.1 hypothetical protein ASPVEDRAFT_86114 [Aspergillus versicolor CBS 583.65]
MPKSQDPSPSKSLQEKHETASTTPKNAIDPASPYAHLHRTREEPYIQITDYASPNNNTLQDALWDAINIDDGIVALSDIYASKHDLPTAQLRFPWDLTKGVYVLHGFHNLYCVKTIHASLSEFRAGKPQSSSWGHVSYCLDALRRQVLCDADDTPRATERRDDTGGEDRQKRKCRDWDGLVQFARENTACYRQPGGGGNGGDDGKSVLERFKHCPQGSGYVVDDSYVSNDTSFVGLPGEPIVQGVV